MSTKAKANKKVQKALRVFVTKTERLQPTLPTLFRFAGFVGFISASFLVFHLFLCRHISMFKTVFRVPTPKEREKSRTPSPNQPIPEANGWSEQELQMKASLLESLGNNYLDDDSLLRFIRGYRLEENPKAKTLEVLKKTIVCCSLSDSFGWSSIVMNVLILLFLFFLGMATIYFL